MSNIQKSFDAIIKAKIDKYLNVKIPVDKGKVISVSDGIAIVSGLGNVKNNEVVKFENNTMGIAIELSYDFIGVALLGKYDDISEGSQVVRTNDVISIPVGDEMLGRVVNPLGEALDGGKAVSKKKLMPIERNAPGVIQRSGINEPLETGIILIDSIFPIGKGQRELIIGDRQTGKSSIALDTIVNQKGKNVKCVYVGIGLKNSTTSQLINFLSKNEALQYTTIMATNASDNPALLYIAPYSGMRIAEE
jgi:F-type H+-transporting ATPase subunit alpha